MNLSLLLDTNNHAWRMWSIATYSAERTASEITAEQRFKLKMFTPDKWNRENEEYMNCVRSIVQNTKEATFRNFRYMFLNGIYNLMYSFKPNEYILALDDRGKLWRHGIYPEYKANRKYSPTLVYPKNRQINKVADPETGDLGEGVTNQFTVDEMFEIFREMMISIKQCLGNIKIIRLKGIEADDIIATIARKKLLNNSGDEHVIAVTNDGDYVQLLALPNFKLWNPTKSGKFVTSVDPEWDLRYKIMIGDSSDNIPNMKYGLGKVKCEQILNFTHPYEGGIEEIWKNDPNAREQYIFNRQLIDMSMIPTEIQNKCWDAYLNCTEGDIKFGEWRNYVLNNGLVGLVSDQMKFASALKNMKENNSDSVKTVDNSFIS